MLKIAFDKVDITPGPGGWIGICAKPSQVPPRDPLFGRLFLLEDDNRSTLVISLDYGGLYLSAHDDWRAELAAALNIPCNQVILHCVHQHDAPFVDFEAVKLYDPELSWAWFDKVKSDVKTAAMALKKQLQEVKSLGWSETRVYGYASNRRVPMEDGSIAVRFSRCGDPAVKNKPVGVIDPMLRTLGFYGKDDKLLAAWSFYGTHPQVANTGERFGADAPGEAMRLLELDQPGVMHSLFNGFFGNVTAGKYSGSDLEENIRVFGKKLADAITLNTQAMEKVSAGKIEWKREVFKFPARSFSETDYERLNKHHFTIALAMRTATEYCEQRGNDYAVEMLEIGDAKVIFVDGELFSEYAVYAQNLAVDQKLAVVGNCGDSCFYIGTAEALSNPEGYEVNSFCRVKPEFEDLFKATLRKMLVD
ncbi:MAG: hypothetical protein E7047_10125 [Lentisphaerae bacterium]|nr:hypothetical protein [Lentisphaerota bacterium]